jgi:multiple sugar transport system substrate-binding protein
VIEMTAKRLTRREFLKITAVSMGSMAALAACGGAATPQPAAEPAQEQEEAAAPAAPAGEKVQIRVAHAWDASFWPRQEEFDKKFNETHPDIEAIGENTPWGEFRNKYMTQAAAGSLPDIIYCQFALAQQFIQQGSFINLQSYIDADPNFKLDDFTAPSLVSYKKDGDLYLVPYDEGPLLLYWNVDMFDKQGVEHPTPDWTMEDLLEAAIKLTHGEGPNKVLVLMGCPHPMVR